MVLWSNLSCIRSGGRGFESCHCQVPSIFSVRGQREKEKEEMESGKWKLNLKHLFHVDVVPSYNIVCNININCISEI